jgi:uncharacterized protein
MEVFGVFLALGAAGGFLSGMLGVGGALIMIPMMLEIPPLCGLPRLDMQDVAGLSMLQVVFASISGTLRHRRNRCVHLPLFFLLGLCMAGGSLIGALLSKWMPETALMIVFGVMLIAAAGMLLLPEPRSCGADEPCDRVPFRRGPAAAMGCGVGLMAGMVGAGGGFLLVPLMIYGLRIPVRTTVGTSLGVVLIGGLAGGAGKIFTGQVVWLPALALIVGSATMAQVGAIVSHKTPAKVLRLLLMLVVLLSGVQIWRRIILQLGAAGG